MTKPPSRIDPRVVKTFGETFVDGSALELVTPASSGRLALLFRKGGKKTIASQIECSDLIYRPPDLDDAMWRAIRFPRDVKSYGLTGKLLRRIQQLFEQYVGLSKPDSAFITAWVASSWFPDCLSSPPTLLISGPDMAHAITLFRLLHCVCRRPLLLADISRSAFLSLASVGATLLINQPGLSPKIRDLWSTCNYRGVHVFGNGRCASVATSKAIFLGMGEPRGGEGIHFALRPASCDFSLLDEQQQSRIADELQPQLLMYRLSNFETVRKLSAREFDSMLPNTPVGRSLAASVLGEADVVKLIAPILRTLEQDKITERGCDVHVAMIEVIWKIAHKDHEIGVSRLTELTNAVLRSRGEVLEYGASEIGWRLKNLGFARHRNGQGMILKFSYENRLLLHRIAAQAGLGLDRVKSCAICCPEDPVDDRKAMKVM
jgi:hypothetical protein